MKNKLKYLAILISLLICGNVNAWTGQWCEYGTKLFDPINDSVEVIEVDSFRETTDANDEYLTIEKNSTIIGNTKFADGVIITASMASEAGYDYAILRAAGDHHGLDYNKKPEIYVYYGEIGGWYKLDINNAATYVEDDSMLQTQDIYSVNYSGNNVRKGIQIPFFNNASVNNLYDGNPVDYLNVESSCADLGIYSTLSVSSKSANLKYFVSSYSDEIRFLPNVNKMIIARHNAEKSSYDFSVNDVVIEDIEESVTGQKKVYIRDLNGNNNDGYLNIIFTNGNSERIYVNQNGYLLPNASSIESIVFTK